jgi:hypothetical protein
MPFVEKSLGAQTPNVNNMASKIEPETPSSDNGDPSRSAEDKPEKEKEGSMKDYFVSGESEHLH